jgi:alpha-beta hydrolase superfamily lysophospholipase
MERFTTKASDGANLSCRLWQPSGTPRALVQLAHGAGEHLGRYQELACNLNRHDLVVIGGDHRGHGDNRLLHGIGDFGPGGFATVIDDLACVARVARSRWSDLPLVLLGHSMGSFAAQAFLASHPELLDVLVLSGTTAIDIVLQAGPEGSLTTLNAGFEPARTPFDWLSRDSVEVDRYIADPLCGFDPTAHSIGTLGGAVSGVREPRRLTSALAKQIPILVLSGEFDPVGGPDQVLASLVADDYRRSGLRQVKHIVYPGARHELFFETSRHDTITDLLSWIDEQLQSIS